MFPILATELRAPAEQYAIKAVVPLIRAVRGLFANAEPCAIEASVSATFAGVLFAEKVSCALKAAAFPHLKG